MIRGSLASLTLSLVALVSIIRLGSSLYLPALSKMESELHIPAHNLTATMSVYFGSFAVAALLAGPVADSRGRRPLIFGGIALFLVGTVLCALARGLEMLMAGRVLQAIGGSSIPVVSRAMIGDTCDEDEIIQVMGWIGVLNSLAPVLAPILGGILTQYLGWRSNFYFLLVATALIGLYAWRTVPETLAVEKRTPLQLGFVLRAFGSMLASRLFMGVLLPVFFCFALQGAYLSLAPFVFMRELQLSSLAFGLTTLPLVLALMLGRSLCLFCLRRMGADRVFVLSGGLVLLSGVGAGAVAHRGDSSVLGLLLPTMLFCLGFGSLMPLGLRSVMKAFAHLGGTAAALNTSLMLAASAAGSAAAGMALAHGQNEFQALCWATALCGPPVFLTCVGFRKCVT